eukprot:4818523-Lingulodinium_polyedra.AAC.1
MVGWGQPLLEYPSPPNALAHFRPYVNITACWLENQLVPCLTPVDAGLPRGGSGLDRLPEHLE